MNRLDAMLSRLPPVYRTAPGSVLHQVLAVSAMAMAALDEDMDRVQRSHWIDTAFDRREMARLGALFDIPPAPWEPDRLYRARLKATIAARLRGAVTRAELEGVLVSILNGAQEALGLRYMRLDARARKGKAVFATGQAPNPGLPAFVEFPPRRQRSAELSRRLGRLRPFDAFPARNLGLFATPLEGAFWGVPGRRTAVPVLVNLTNGTVMAYGGAVPCGKCLRFAAAADGSLRADLDGTDVSDRLLTGSGYDPDRRPDAIQPHALPRPLRLERGDNDLWFFPLALFDAPGLDVARLAMPPSRRQLEAGDRRVQQGQFDSNTLSGEVSAFDAAVFYEQPAAVLDVWWAEARPATFRFEIPAGVVRREAGDHSLFEVDHGRLFALMQQTVDLLRAAAVHGEVLDRPLRERQRTVDRVVVLRPDQGRETARSSDALVALSALFDTTAIDGARFE